MRMRLMKSLMCQSKECVKQLLENKLRTSQPLVTLVSTLFKRKLPIPPLVRMSMNYYKMHNWASSE